MSRIVSPKASFASNSSTKPVRSSNFTDGRERLVRNRLRWLEGNWDGKIPPPKSPLPAAGPQQSTCERRQVAQDCRERALEGGDASDTCVPLDRFANVPCLTDGTGEDSDADDAPTRAVQTCSTGGWGDLQAPADRRDLPDEVEPTTPSRSEPPSTRSSQPGGELSDPEVEAGGAFFCGDDDDDDNGDDDASSQADGHVREMDLTQITSTSDTASEISSETFPVPAMNEEDSVKGKDDQHPSNELSAQGTPSTPLESGNEVTSWQSRALRAEHALASLRSLHAVTESTNVAPLSTTPARGVGRVCQSLGHDTLRAPFSEPLSQVSAAASGFEIDGQPKMRESETSPCFPPTGSGMVLLRDQSDTVSSALQFAEIVVAECSSCACRDVFDGRGHKRLQEEVASLKLNLRDAEVRQAAAEATAVSVLQRARAAELSRDVKEIQIRNLEIRLAKYTNSDKQHQAACAQWRERHHGAGCDGDALDSFPWREPLSAVEEEPPSQYAANNSSHSPTTTVTGSDSAACVESVLHEPATSPALAKSTNGASALRAWGARLRKIEGTFRQNYTVLGARATQAGEGAAAVAAAARKAAQEAAQSSAVGRGQNKGDGGRWRTNTRSQAKLDGIAFDEYWGSDYCTSV